MADDDTRGSNRRKRSTNEPDDVPRLSRAGRGEETRRAILRAAEEVFAERGYAGARMEDVAERVGIRRASVVHHFSDKQRLYVALLDDLFGGLLEGYRAALSGPDPLTERLLRCIDVWVERVESRPGLLRISLWEMARASPSEAVPMTSRVQPIVSLLVDTIREGQAQGLCRNDVEPVGLVMSVAGTTAFLGLRTNLLGAEVAAPMGRGTLRTELRGWFARMLFDATTAG
ncbi:MAG TPA: TetR/AcrR family transcriptional regulator [Candidatus Binatia bacterium]|nr:TetR/AcrR family transcriptional regulator [Candidatus Binatia bacterium]